MRTTTSRSRWLAITGLIAGLAMILAACGGDDDTTAQDDSQDAAADTDDAADDTDDAADDAGDDAADDAPAATGLLAELQESGTIRVGVANEVPYGYVGDDGEPTGIAPDVARAVLAELGITNMEATVVEFGELIGGLQAGQFDMITAGMYINPDRAAQIHFSDPDYCVAESLGVPAGNPAGLVDYQSVVDNPDITIAVATGTVELDYALDAGVPESQIQLFSDIDGMYRALEAGEVDAVTGTAATIETQAAARDSIDALPGFFPKDTDGNDVLPCGGHGFADEDLRDAFNEVLNRFRADGTTKEIILQYDAFSAEDVDLANSLTLEDFLD